MGLRPQCVAALLSLFQMLPCASQCYEICFYKNILQYYHKIEKSEKIKRQNRLHNKNIGLTTSKHLTRIKNTTTAVCVCACVCWL